MDQNPQTQSGIVPNPSEPFRSVPHHSEAFGTFPNASESFRSVPHRSERKETHTLTVREVARLFEAAGVARTERSITNWCQPNRDGLSRLDSYFDPNERKYYISRQSVDRAIEEEKAKAAKEAPLRDSESFGTILNPSEAPISEQRSESFRKEPKTAKAEDSGDVEEVTALNRQIQDLQITNRAKDYFIDQLKSQVESFGVERREYVEKLMTYNRKVGELETRLLQLEAPRDRQVGADEDPAANPEPRNRESSAL